LHRFHQQRVPLESSYALPRKPPEFLLDTDGDTADMSNQHQIPSEILYLLKSVKSVDLDCRHRSLIYIDFIRRVFGHFERPIFFELCKYLESKVVLAGAYLFRIGDADDSLYVVQKGLLHVFITDEVRLLTRQRSISIGIELLETSSTFNQRMCRK
jgi:lysophospholipid hydrolase